MKLTKLFSHACDEGGNVTRSYVKVFTNSRKCDFQRYYSYLLKNKMFSELNNLTQAMKMFGFFGRVMDWVAPNLSKKYRDAKMGVEMAKMDDMAKRVNEDRNNRVYTPQDLLNSGVAFTSDMFDSNGNLKLDGNLKKSAFMHAVHPEDASSIAYKLYRTDPNRGKSGSVNEALKDIPTEESMLEDNDIMAKQAIDQYGRNVITKGTDYAANELNKAIGDNTIQHTDPNTGRVLTMRNNGKKPQPRVISSVGADGRKRTMTVTPKSARQ